ncbi:MAG: sigma-E factor negative regulatory protein [Methylococcales bacterium]|nr:sigma-E factor negative regulatory protein [Methylococcales bacterium]
MDENVNQKISCFMDDELDGDEALKLLKKIQLEPELRHKFNDYQRVSYALSSKKNLPINDNFLDTIQQGISNEPLYFPSVNHKPPSKKTYGSYLALAASVALIALLLSKFVNPTLLDDTPISPTVIADISEADSLPKPINSQDTPISPPVIAAISKADNQLASLSKPVNSQETRFNDYLQAHNTRFYTQGSVNFQPYAQTVSYRQD